MLRSLKSMRPLRRRDGPAVGQEAQGPPAPVIQPRSSEQLSVTEIKRYDESEIIRRVESLKSRAPIVFDILDSDKINDTGILNWSDLTADRLRLYRCLGIATGTELIPVIPDDSEIEGPIWTNLSFPGRVELINNLRQRQNEATVMLGYYEYRELHLKVALKSAMRNDAVYWIGIDGTFKEMYDRLLKHFFDGNSLMLVRALNHFNTCKQNQNERIDTYVGRFNNMKRVHDQIAKNCNTALISETQETQAFKANLLPIFRVTKDADLTKENDQMSSIGTLIALATKEEHRRAYNIEITDGTVAAVKRVRAPAAASASATATKSDKLIKKKRSSPTADGYYGPAADTADKPKSTKGKPYSGGTIKKPAAGKPTFTGECWRCKKIGHRSFECPLLPKASAVVQVRDGADTSVSTEDFYSGNVLLSECPVTHKTAALVRNRGGARGSGPRGSNGRYVKARIDESEIESKEQSDHGSGAESEVESDGGSIAGSVHSRASSISEPPIVDIALLCYKMTIVNFVTLSDCDPQACYLDNEIRCTIERFLADVVANTDYDHLGERVLTTRGRLSNTVSADHRMQASQIFGQERPMGLLWDYTMPCRLPNIIGEGDNYTNIRPRYTGLDYIDLEESMIMNSHHGNEQRDNLDTPLQMRGACVMDLSAYSNFVAKVITVKAFISRIFYGDLGHHIEGLIPRGTPGYADLYPTSVYCAIIKCQLRKFDYVDNIVKEADDDTNILLDIKTGAVYTILGDDIPSRILGLRVPVGSGDQGATLRVAQPGAGTGVARAAGVPGSGAEGSGVGMRNGISHGAYSNLQIR
jgi:Zinc knuckle